MHKFKIFYDGQEPYTGDPQTAPVLGVLCIIEIDKDHGRRLVTNGDYYVLRERWYAVDFVGLVDYLVQPGWKKVLIGRLIDREEYYKAIHQAETDPDFPIRTGWAQGEEKL